MLTTTANVFAQLYITPNGASSADSYIYVDNEVLFVEQDINLVVNNNDPTTEASIYLRNQAQLVQGTTVSTNSGTGYISVFQDSKSDSYDYNFWGSPVGNMSGSGNNNFGMARVNDSLSLTNSTVALTTVGYNGASSPLTISTRWYYRWNPATQRYVYNGTGDVVPPGRGFIMKGTDVTVHIDPFSDPQNQLYDFRGRPNSG
ncbi:MAG: secretion protein, partial [Bacteroidetes bacterium]